MSWVTDENVDPALQDWGEAYKELCAIIKAGVPEVKHIDLYYGQEQIVGEDGNWIPFPVPAVFLQFNAAQVDDIGDTSQQLLMDVQVILCMETTLDTNHGSKGLNRALKFIAIMRKLHQALHDASGDHFSPLSRVALNRLEAPPYAQVYGQTYRCVMLDNSTSKQWTFRDPPLALEIDPITGDPVVPLDPRFVIVHNSDDTYSVEVEGGNMHPLPDVTHTDSDGNAVVLPAMTPFVATLCSGGGGKVRILPTAGGTPIATVAAPADYPLPSTQVPYIDVDGDAQLTAPVITGHQDGTLRPGGSMPRIAIRNSVNEIIGYADISDPNYVHALQEVRNSNDDLVNEHEVGQAGTAPDAILRTTLNDMDIQALPSGLPIQVKSTALNYVKADGTAGSLGPYNTAYGAPNIHPDIIIERRQLMSVGGLTFTAYASLGGLVNNTVPAVQLPLYMVWSPGDSDTYKNHAEGFVVTAAQVGSYSAFTNDGASGSITMSKNGGAFSGAAFSLALGDRILMRRTITTSHGWILCR